MTSTRDSWWCRFSTQFPGKDWDARHGVYLVADDNVGKLFTNPSFGDEVSVASTTPTTLLRKNIKEKVSCPTNGPSCVIDAEQKLSNTWQYPMSTIVGAKADNVAWEVADISYNAPYHDSPETLGYAPENIDPSAEQCVQ